MKITSEAWRLYYRALRFADVPQTLELLKFKDLRRKYYNNLWEDTAREIGATAERNSYGYIKISKGDLCTFVRQDRVMLDSQLMLNLMGNKAFTYELLRTKSCPIPAYELFNLKATNKAEAFLAKQSGSVVVKPVSGTGGGQGVTTGITDRPGLSKAVKAASRFDTNLIVEQQLEGHSYRLLYLDGVLIHAVRRDPPVLTGDGKKTLAALAKTENTKRLKGSPVTALSPLRLDREAVNTLAVQGLKPASIPAAGQTITVKKAVNQNASDRNHTVTGEVHPETASSCAKLVKDIGVELAGIDIISKDIAVRLSDNGGCIGEINTTPGLHHHYLLAKSQPGISVAARVLNYMFERGRGTMRLEKSFPGAGP
jgi:cyanophycin synthetase